MRTDFFEKQPPARINAAHQFRRLYTAKRIGFFYGKIKLAFGFFFFLSLSLFVIWNNYITHSVPMTMCPNLFLFCWM